MKHVLAALAGTLWLFLSVLPTRAGERTKHYTGTVPQADAPYTFTVALPAFDPSLGGLTGIVINILNSLDADDMVSNSTYANSATGTPYDFTNATTQAPLKVTGPDGSYAYVVAETVLDFGVADQNDNEYLELLASSEGSFIIPDTNFGTYIGGPETTLDFTFAPQAAIFNGTTDAPDGALTFGGTAAVAGSVSVTYTYSSVTLPEPSGIFTLGLAASVLAMVRRWCRTT